MDFVVFSDDWGEHPSSCQHLFRQIAREHRVLWVNTVGMRTLKFTTPDLRKAARKVRRMITGAGRAATSQSGGMPQHLAVLQPPMLPLPASRAARAFNDWSAGRAVRAALARLGMQRPVVVTTAPNACDIVGQLGASVIVYYCVDDFAQWPGIDHQAVGDMERRLVEQADVLLATSEILLEALKGSGKPAFLFDHGVDLETFGAPPGPEHSKLAGMSRPRAGFFGLIDERLDEHLLAEVANLLPDWTFVLAGPQVATLPLLASVPNIVRVGSLPYAELPSFVDGVDVLMLPYKVNAFTQTISPLKLNEYLATGRPVVSAPLRETLRHERLIRLAVGPTEWRDALNAATQHDRHARRAQVASFLASRSWRAKAASFVELLAAYRAECSGNTGKERLS